MIRTRIRKVGNSLGMILPHAALDVLHVKEGDSVCLAEVPGGLRLTAADTHFEDATQAAERGMRRYRNVLRKLAE